MQNKENETKCRAPQYKYRESESQDHKACYTPHKTSTTSVWIHVVSVTIAYFLQDVYIFAFFFSLDRILLLHK